MLFYIFQRELVTLFSKKSSYTKVTNALVSGTAKSKNEKKTIVEFGNHANKNATHP